MMYQIGIALYAACVDFLLQAAQLLGITYRDANAALFFVVWPALTVLLLCVVLWQAWRLFRGGPS
jgi:hypothetical protein